jgi:hypothetical protein
VDPCGGMGIHFLFFKMNWQIKSNREREDDDFGFIYKITNIVNNKFYIGCKQLKKRIRRKPLKGKKRKRIDYVESDHDKYWGSCNELHDDIKKYGENFFKRELLFYCKSKWMLKYLELKTQIIFDVMNPKTNSYNGIINVRLCKPGEALWGKEGIKK